MFILNGTITLKPNEASDVPDSDSTFTKTLNNVRRRSMHNIKYDWQMSMNYMKLSDYESLRTLFEAGNTVTLVNNSLGLNTTVHLDITDHGYIAGSPSYRSGVKISLIEV